MDGTVLRMVDLDLDVVRHRGGETRIEDEDEFAEHQVSYGYPESVTSRARQTCRWLMEAGRRGRNGVEPFSMRRERQDSRCKTLVQVTPDPGTYVVPEIVSSAPAGGREAVSDDS